MNLLIEPQPTTAAATPAAAPADAALGEWFIVGLAERRFALPMAAVETVGAPPPVSAVPHAPPALLGAANIGGRIVPVLDLALLLGRRRSYAAYDGSGSIVGLHAIAGGSGVAIWVDRVERTGSPAVNGFDGYGIEPLDPAQLLAAAAFFAPSMTAGPVGAAWALGEIGKLAPPEQVGTEPDALIIVEAGGRLVAFHRQAAVEVLDAVPWTGIPRPPAGFLGVGIVRGAALPLLSLAALLGQHQRGPAPGGFVAIDMGGRRRALLGVDCVVGLRPASADDRPIDPAAIITDQLRRIILGFPPIEDDPDPSQGTVVPAETTEYLTFAAAGQDCAIAIACIDRVVGPQPWIELPPAVAGVGGDNGADHIRGAGPARVDRAIGLHGQIVPIALLHSRFASGPDPQAPPRAFLILRDARGWLTAIGVDRIDKAVKLRAADISPPSVDERDPIEGVAATAEGGLLRIIDPARLWGDA